MTPRRASVTASREPRIRLRFETHADALLAGFDYSAHCVLVFALDDVASQCAEREREAHLLTMVACWDAALILVGSHLHETALHSLVQSQVAPRLAISPIHMPGAPRSVMWAVQLNRLVTSSHLDPRALRGRVDPSIQQKIALLPRRWRAIVHQAVARPGDWDGERLALECCTSLRTLQRHLRAAGLPSPKRMRSAQAEVRTVRPRTNEQR
jgi:hypothetical protein